MNLIRKYKISKIINTPVKGEDGKIFNFINNWFKDLTPFRVGTTYITFDFYMDEYGDYVFSREINLNSVAIRTIGFADVLLEDYKIPIHDVESLLQVIIKDKFNIEVKSISFAYTRQHQVIEEDYQKYRNESNQKI